MMGNEKKIYTVSYNSRCGVDFSAKTSSSGRERFSYLENMYRDYDANGGEVLESIVGFRKITSLGTKIHALYLQKTDRGSFVLIHAGASLYRFSLEEKDSPTPLSPIKALKDSKSCGFAFGNDFYILDGEKITRVAADGTATYAVDGSSAAPYVPTAYKNGAPHEQRNLLTDLFYEEYFIKYPEEVFAATDSLKYKICDTEKLLVSISGVSSEFSGTLRIPSYIKIGSESYTVAEISEFAFSNNASIDGVIISDGLKKIGKYAFSGCSKLKKAELPDSLVEICDEAFSHCALLSDLRLGASLAKIGVRTFAECTSLQEVKYALDSASLSSVENAASLSALTLSSAHKISSQRTRIPVFSKTKTVSDVFLNGEAVSFAQERAGDDVKSILFPSLEKSRLIGATVKIMAYSHPNVYPESSFGASFSPDDSPNAAFSAICGCNVAECFDGRVFISGNPKYPNTVFYSARDNSDRNNPLYFGILNYWCDGVGGFPVISMLATADSLAVFKAGDDGGGSIYYHVPKSTEIDILPRIYPVSYVHNGVSAIGESISFFDDPLFISSSGVLALDKAKINLERSVVCRSHNVNARLLSEDLRTASVAKWCGYLVISTGGRAYLADSRSLFLNKNGTAEYEWYYLDGIGTYKNDNYVYRYSSLAKKGYSVHQNADKEVKSEVLSEINADDETVFYTLENGIKYELYKTEERTNGIFSPAVKLLSDDRELLLFGTESGDICIFNNDKRGVAPESLSSDEGFEMDEYTEKMGRKIHPEYYSFDGHTPRYALSTVYDDAGVANMTKNSVKASLTLKLETHGEGAFICEVGTDRKGYREVAEYSSRELDFNTFDFSSLAFLSESRITLPISERQKGWVEKQVSLYSKNFRSPFGIYSISYRFYIKGQIKKRKL